MLSDRARSIIGWTGTILATLLRFCAAGVVLLLLHVKVADSFYDYALSLPDHGVACDLALADCQRHVQRVWLVIMPFFVMYALFGGFLLLLRLEKKLTDDRMEQAIQEGYAREMKNAKPVPLAPLYPEY